MLRRERPGLLKPDPRRAEQLHFLEWEPLPPEDDPETPTAKPLSANAGGNGAAVHRPPVRPEMAAQDETSPEPVTNHRRDPDPYAGKVFDIEPEAKPSRDFRITSAHRIGEGGLQEKARDNIAAIRLLKILEKENRDATDDEKSILARYAGWGAIPNVFGLHPAFTIRSEVRDARRCLSPGENRVIALLYDFGWQSREVAAELHVNESRVSQIKARAISKLRACLQAGSAGRAA